MLRLSYQPPEGAMAPQGEAGFPATLSTWVREIVGAIPGPARSTIAELLVGAMLGGGGHVTRALLAVTPRRGWQAYHGMLATGCWSGAASACSAWSPRCAASSGARPAGHDASP